MRIRLVVPRAPIAHTGNRVTVSRWAALLRELGHRAAIAEGYRGEPCEVLVVLHARKGHDAARRYRRIHPRAPLVVALAGTDLYGDLPANRKARESLRLASRIIVLQPRALRALPRWARAKARVIVQSARRPRLPRPRPLAGAFEVCVLAHLRAVKDPLATARATRLLPAESRVRVTHAGATLDRRLARQARAEQATNRRYRWLGELDEGQARRVLARSRLLSLTSRMEGGANVVSEAIACSVPVISTRIPGSIGILGPDYPGYFPVGDTRTLAGLLARAESDRAFYRKLRARCTALRPLVRPERERQSWKELLDELVGTRPR